MYIWVYIIRVYGTIQAYMYRPIYTGLYIYMGLYIGLCTYMYLFIYIQAYIKAYIQPIYSIYSLFIQAYTQTIYRPTYICLYIQAYTVLYIQGDSGGICTTLGNDSMSDSMQKSSYEHGSDFERLRSYDRLKLGIEGNDY